jgi:glycosyltransferase involved in cell wall biosynthesis
MHEKDILVFSSFPKKGKTHEKNTVGVASYTKNILKHVSQYDSSFRFTVLSEVLTKPETYQEENITVQRVWKRNQIPSIVKTVLTMRSLPQQHVLVSFEIRMVGSMSVNIPFFLSLILLKLAGKKLTIIVHQVVRDFGSVEPSPIKTWFLNRMKNILYLYITLLFNHIIVFEAAFRKQFYNAKKCIVIPHAIEELPRLSQAEARAELKLQHDKTYLLCFGYISPYKGLRELLEQYKPNLGKLIIAGGENPHLTNDPTYRRYAETVFTLAKSKKAHITGYIMEKHIPHYYHAADIVLFPYLLFFSSSGPLSFAFAAEKPVLISHALKDYALSKDIRKGLQQANLTLHDITFDLSKDNLSKKLTNVENKKQSFIQFSKYMKNVRSWNNISQIYAKYLVY